MMDRGASQHIDTMVESLLARATSGQQCRVVDALLASVTHIHSVLKEMRPKPDEWRSVIDFLTDVGHSSNVRRQEWVLLSDVIGASTLVEEMNSVRPDGATPNTLPGPFYRADVPEMENGSKSHGRCRAVGRWTNPQMPSVRPLCSRHGSKAAAPS